MSSFLLSQIIVACAFAVGMASFQFRSKNHVSLAWFVTTLLIGIHFFLLDSPEAGTLTLITSLRFLASIFSNKVSVMLGFIGLSCIGFYFTYQSPSSWIVLIAVLLGTYSSFLNKDQQFRLTMMFIGIVWVAYNIIIGSPVAIAMELSFIVSNCLAYYRIYIKKQANSNIASGVEKLKDQE